MQPGDSGSLLFTRIGGKNIAVGLCFAGSETVAIANPIKYIVEKGVWLGKYYGKVTRKTSTLGLLSMLLTSLYPLFRVKHIILSNIYR